MARLSAAPPARLTAGQQLGKSSQGSVLPLPAGAARPMQAPMAGPVQQTPMNTPKVAPRNTGFVSPARMKSGGDIKLKESDEANDVIRPEDMQKKTKVTPKPVPKPKSKESDEANDVLRPEDMQKKTYKKGGVVKSGASRGDGCAQRGRTKGTMR